MEAVVEALLFVSGDGLHVDKLSDITGMDKKSLIMFMNEMMANYMTRSSGLMIREINNCYQLCTRPEHFEFIRKLGEVRQKQALSQAAYETLAITAYNQPITRAGLEKIRGVNSDSAVAKLLERNLIREAGRLDAPGRPILYETTEEFLKSFGFKSLSELPVLEMNEFVQENELPE